MNPQILSDLKQFHPEIILTASVLLVVIGDIALVRIRRTLTFILAAAGLIAALIAGIRLFGQDPGTLFFGVLSLDPMSVFFKTFLILTSLFILFSVPGSKELSRRNLGEFYALLLGVTLAMVLLAASADMLMLYLALETVSIGSYILVGYLRNERQSNEASLKYLLFGAIATGTMLYGMTVIYGLTGTTKLAAIREAFLQGAAAGNNSAMLLIATVMVLAGFGFKMAAVPFHFWCPDVYTGAPTPVTAFLSIGPKAAGFAVLMRFFFTGFSGSAPGTGMYSGVSPVYWNAILILISVVTMTLGNIAALRQENMKRMLAYSSIAHAGYILMGAVVLNSQGLQSVLVYLVTYLFMNLGAFLVVIAVYNHTGSFDLNDYRGLMRRSPFLTVAMSFFMLSLMGIPPFAGFLGKLYVFGAAVNNNLAWLAVVGALNSVVAIYYYARVIKAMVIEESSDTTRVPLSLASQILLWLMLLPTAGLMFFWSGVERLTKASVALFMGL
ncbi:MAG: NADH-quinone oxidoreductase subunit N [Acidobacteria bacterium]|nr:NADH-quinone oxidoreductase subunit N [Acidobacteriota bacterium]